MLLSDLTGNLNSNTNDNTACLLTGIQGQHYCLCERQHFGKILILNKGWNEDRGVLCFINLEYFKEAFSC